MIRVMRMTWPVIWLMAGRPEPSAASRARGLQEFPGSAKGHDLRAFEDHSRTVCRGDLDAVSRMLTIESDDLSADRAVELRLGKMC